MFEVYYYNLHCVSVQKFCPKQVIFNDCLKDVVIIPQLLRFQV